MSTRLNLLTLVAVATMATLLSIGTAQAASFADPGPGTFGGPGSDETPVVPEEENNDGGIIKVGKAGRRHRARIAVELR